MNEESFSPLRENHSIFNKIAGVFSSSQLISNAYHKKHIFERSSHGFFDIYRGVCIEFSFLARFKAGSCRSTMDPRNILDLTTIDHSYLEDFLQQHQQHQPAPFTSSTSYQLENTNNGILNTIFANFVTQSQEILTETF